MEVRYYGLSQLATSSESVVDNGLFTKLKVYFSSHYSSCNDDMYLLTVFPGKPFLDYYALPCTKLFMVVFLSLAVTFRIKMVCGVHVC